MSFFYALPAGEDDALIKAARLVVGVGMAVALTSGLLSVLRRDFGAHRAWMVRGYAIGIGAGTQVLTTVTWLLLVGKPEGTTRSLLLIAGWAINLAVAEWVIRFKRPT
jgi:hypothetical protein